MLSKTIASPVLDAIDQNTRGESEGYAAGVPRYFAWCGGAYRPPGEGAPPSDFTAVTGWAQVYPQLGSPDVQDSRARVIVANAKTYVRFRTTREWILVQDQATDQIAGAHYVADFGSGPTEGLKIEKLQNGSVALSAPSIGFNTHFWLTTRGTYQAGSIDRVYVQMDMKADTRDVKLVANVGADWWRDAVAAYEPGFANNPGVGMSNWVKLSTEWSTLRFYSGNAPELQASAPAPRMSPVTEATAAIVRRRASGPAPCVSRP